MNRWVVTTVALVIGFFLLSADQHSDDTGIEVGLIVISALACASIAPRAQWAIALAVGLPIALFDGVLGGSTAAIVALVFSSLGAGMGAAIRRWSAAT